MSQRTYSVLLGQVCLLLILSLFLPASGHAFIGVEEALDSPVQIDGTTPLTFTTEGAALWSAVTMTGYNNTSGTAAKSGTILGNAYSSLTTTVTGTASVSFYQKSSSQLTYDKLTFSLDNLIKSTISGTVNWQQKVFTLPTGTHTLVWKYSKNSLVNGGSDAAWLDKVVVSPYTALKVTSPNGGGKLSAGSYVDITWNAPAAAEKYDLYYTANSGSTWTSIAKGLLSPNFTNITYSWLVPVPAGGNRTGCKVKVVARNAANVVVGTDVSDSYFGIEVLKVTSPNGGEIVSDKTGTFTIGFVVSGLTNTAAGTTASIYYTADGGVTWPLIGKITGGSTITPGAYTFPWNVPVVSSIRNSKVKVVIKTASGSVLATDTSDANVIINPVFTISGVVTLNAKALAGVTMTLGGDESGTTTTDVAGKYSFKTLLKGNYTVWPAKTDNFFNPASKAVPLTTASVTTASFKATASTDTKYALSGTVSAGTGTNANVTMTLTGLVGGTALTDGSGNYSFADLPEGNYVVTPGRTGYTFGPLSRPATISAANATGVDFTASAASGAVYSISGKATLKGAALPGVLITVSGEPSGAGITDAYGNYSIKGLKSGSHTVTPGKFGYTFTPASAVKNITTASISYLNFAATAAPTVRGTAAIGAPIAGATVTLIDSAGHAPRTAETAGNGTYGIETADLVPPFLLLVTNGTGSTFYSVSADAAPATTVNITPLTDLIIRSWYEVQEVSVDLAFADPATHPAPAPTAVTVLSSAVQNMMQLWLNQAGVTAANFNLITTPFSTGGTGIDAVLDRTAVDTATGSVLVSDGTTTQASTLSVLYSALTISTTTTNTDKTSSNNNTTAVPVQTEQQTALDSITARMAAFANTVAVRGSYLRGSDLAAHMDAALVHDGMSRTQFANFLAAYLKGAKLSTSAIRIKSLNTTTGLAEVTFQIAVTMGAMTDRMPYDFSFRRQIDNTWLIFGNDRIAGIELRALMNTNQGSYNESKPVIEADVMAAPPVDIVAGATVSGGGFWTDAPLYKYPPTTDEMGTHDAFGLMADVVGEPLPAGTPFTFAVTLASGQTGTYEQKLNSFTNDPIRITSPTGYNISDAHLGSLLTVNWTLPTTYAIGQVWLDFAVYTGPENSQYTKVCKFMGPTLGIASTTAQIRLPATCNSLPVTNAVISLQAIGVNGENSMVHYGFGPLPVY